MIWGSYSTSHSLSFLICKMSVVFNKLSDRLNEYICVCVYVCCTYAIFNLWRD